MTKLKRVMHKYRMSRYKAHRVIVQFNKAARKWKGWKQSDLLQNAYINYLCNVIAHALYNGEQQQVKDGAE